MENLARRDRSSWDHSPYLWDYSPYVNMCAWSITHNSACQYMRNLCCIGACTRQGDSAQAMRAHATHCVHKACGEACTVRPLAISLLPVDVTIRHVRRPRRVGLKPCLLLGPRIATTRHKFDPQIFFKIGPLPHPLFNISIFFKLH